MKKWKYKIIEYEYKTLVYSDHETKIEVCKQLHKTNSFLMYLLIIICFKINGIKYDVVKEW